MKDDSVPLGAYLKPSCGRPRLNRIPALHGLVVSAAVLAVACSNGGDTSIKQPAEPVRQVATPATSAAKKQEAKNMAERMAKALATRARPIVGQLPAVVDSESNPVTEAKVVLGRQLFFETRLSKNHDLSCSSCHNLAGYGVDIRVVGGKTSMGHGAAMGGRNSPTVYNAALHIAQFWDGREPDVEAQAKGPVLNPVEMAMPSEKSVVGVLKSIPGYRPLFEAAFPDDRKPLTYDNMARAIGAFERKLITPSRFDQFLAGQWDALSSAEQGGLAVFLQAGCTACHIGPALGGRMYQKLGLMKPYPTADVGRSAITGNEADKFFFKVPSLRNIAKTAPYLHDGSIATLDEMVDVMAEYQTPRGKLKASEKKALLAFLSSLTGELPADYIKAPQPLAGGPKTPKPNPN